jgi:hypothetical protein
MEYKNPEWSSETTIDCEVNHPKFGWVPFTCNPSDVGAVFDVSSLFNLMKVDKTTVKFTAPPTPDPAEIQAGEVRRKRNELLVSEVDPVAGHVLRWNSLTAEEQEALADYRQALLDVPQQSGFPQSVIWPTY